MEDMKQLKKDMETVLGWRKLDKKLTKEEQFFADKTVEKMIALKFGKHAGAQLVSRENVEFIKKYEPAGIVQDATEQGQAKDGKFPLKTKKKVEKIAKPKGEKPAEVPISDPEVAEDKRQTPDIQNIKLEHPENYNPGEPTETADSDTEGKDEAGEPDKAIPSEQLGHEPNDPMPKKMAEDLIQNAKWGVEVGAYTNVKEGIERQLGRKDYAEFTDTPEKYKSVAAYLVSLIGDTEVTPVA